MSADSPVVVLYNADGVAMAVANGIATPVGATGVILVGSDGTNLRFVRTAADGTMRTDPTGTTTQPVSGTVAVSGTVPVSGPLTDTQLRATPVPISNTNLDVLLSTRASEATLATRASEATLASLNSKDFATQTTLAAFLAAFNAEDFATQTTLAALLAAFNAEDFATQTTLALIKAKTDNLDVALSTRSTEATLLTRLSKADFEARINTLGQKVMSASTPVTFASDQSPLSVTLENANAVTGVSSGLLTLGGSTANTLQVVRATAYTEPTAAAQRSFASNNANDTAAGTGLRSLRVTYFDNTGNGPYTEDVTLNGTTPVNTVATNIRFIETMEALTVGSLGANAGVITLYSTTGGGGTVIGTVGYGSVLTGAGDNRTIWAHHYIPAGKTGEYAVLDVGVQSGGSGTNGKFFITSQQPLVANAAEVRVGGVLLAIGGYSRTYDYHPRVEGFARLTGYCIPGVNNASVALAFDWQEYAS